MSSLAAAFFTAALALVGKVLYDAWARFEDRRGLAGALAGELGAYIAILNIETFTANLEAIAGQSKEERTRRVKMFANVPSGHPVFDSVAAKIGLLGYESAQGVSRAYNVVTGVRLLLIGMAQPSFAELCEEEQKQLPLTIVAMLRAEEPLGKAVVERLRATGGASVWKVIWKARQATEPSSLGEQRKRPWD